PLCPMKVAPGGLPDCRCYRVAWSQRARTLPQFTPQWTVPRGIEELQAAFRRYGLTRDEFLGARYLRIKQIQKLQREGLVDATLHWRSASADAPIAVRL